MSFAEGGFGVYGGLATVSFLALGFSPYLALPLALAGAIVMGGLLQALLSTARKGSNELTYIMSTIGVAIALQGLAHQIWGTDFKTFPLYPEWGRKIAAAAVS